METKMIDVKKCVVPEKRITAVYDEELRNLLRDSLQATGQIVPIIVVQHEEVFYVCDGKHRLEEAILRGDTEIAAVVRPGSPADVMILNLVTNRTRGKVKASEMVQVLAALYEDHGLQIGHIVEKTGFSQDYIERLIKISEAAPEVQEALDLEVIGVGAAYEISRIPSHTAQAEMVNKLAIWKWKLSELKGFVDQVLKEMEEIPKGPQFPKEILPDPEFFCAACKTKQDPRDLRQVPMCPDCYGEAWRASASKREETTAEKPPVEPSASTPAG